MAKELPEPSIVFFDKKKVVLLKLGSCSSALSMRQLKSWRNIMIRSQPREAPPKRQTMGRPSLSFYIRSIWIWLWLD